MKHKGIKKLGYQDIKKEQIQFIHCADLHIGTNRIDNQERKRDFLDSFKDLANYAITSKINFIVISGDFFDKKQIDPDSLEGAISILSLLRDAKIDVLVIEGNHDASIYSEENSWLYFLSKKNYLKLLQTKFSNGEPIITEWDDKSKVGSYMDYGDIRIFGVGYLGASTKKKIELIESKLVKNKFNIMLLHASVNAMIQLDLGGVKKEDLMILKDKINYLALGHIHHKEEIDNWIFNPGSLENWRLEEAGNKKGFFHVILESGKIKKVIFRESKKRPIYLWKIDISGCKTCNDVYKRVLEYADKNKPITQERPIISITFVGKVEFSTIQIDNEFIKKEIEEKFNPLICEIKDGANILMSNGKVTILPNRNEIEREEIGKIIDLYPEYKKKKDELINLVLSFKTKALTEFEDTDLIELIKNNISELK